MNNITLESPGYTQAAHIFHNNGLTVTPGTMDKSGLSTSSIAPESSIVYVTPSHQFPLGTVMPYGRRVELLTWAKASADRYIIEDDHDSEFRYRGKPIPALQGMDDENRVIYIGRLHDPSTGTSETVRTDLRTLFLHCLPRGSGNPHAFPVRRIF